MIRDKESVRRAIETALFFLVSLLVLLGFLKLLSGDRFQVNFADAGFEEAVRENLNKPKGKLTWSDLRKVTHLDASSRGIQSLQGIEYLSALVELDLSNNQVSDLGNIDHLQKLKKLDLSGNELEDLRIPGFEGLANIKLRSLNLSYNYVEIGYGKRRSLSDIGALAWFRFLEELELEGNHLRNVDALESLTNLTRLNLSGNLIEDISFLGTLKELEELNMYSNRIREIDVLSELGKLRELDLSANYQINKLEALASLENLKELNISGVNIDGQLPVLLGLKKLENLQADSCRVDDSQALFDYVTELRKSRGLEPQFDSPIVISELMNSNLDTISSIYGEHKDWIELYNRSNSAVSLKGWSLSDNDNRPFKWIFPDVVIEPDQYLLVWASGKDRNNYYSDVLVADWLGDKSTTNSALNDQSGRENHFHKNTEVKFLTTEKGTTVEFDGDREKRLSANSGSLSNLTGNLTISMWIKPLAFDGRQNPLDKAYFGEGAITLGPNGHLIYYWGVGSTEGQYQSVFSKKAIPLNKWTHVMLVRDLDAGKLHWYFNGDRVTSVDAKFDQAANTTEDWLLGAGYAGGFKGQLAQVKIFNQAIKPDEIEQACALNKLELHTNFAISSGGECIYLSDPGGLIADVMHPIHLPRNFSQVVSKKNKPRTYSVSKPSPGKPNKAEDEIEWLRPPVFSHPGGFYDQPFDLSLETNDPDSIILYTLDGSVPSLENLGGKTFYYKNEYPEKPGTPFGEMLEAKLETFKYENAIPIQDRSPQPNVISEFSLTIERRERFYQENPPVPKATIVRAKTIREGNLESEVISHSYFLIDRNIGQETMLIASLMTGNDNLFDYEKGIFSPGKPFDDWRKAKPNRARIDGKQVNYWERGKLWERPVHLEIMEGNVGKAVLQQNLGIRVHGNASRGYRQKSVKLYARNEYDKKFIHYPFFNERPYDLYKNITFRNAGQGRMDYFRDAFAQYVVKNLRVDYQGYRPSLLFLNGEFWGIYNVRERHDEFFLNRRYGLDPEKVEISGYEFGLGEWDTYFDPLVKYVQEYSMLEKEHWDYLKTQIDTNSFIDYYIANIFACNADWMNNARVWRSVSRDDKTDVEDGRWRWMLYDFDFSWGYVPRHLDFHESKNLFPSVNKHLLMKKLFFNKFFQEEFILRFSDLNNTTFQPERVLKQIDQFEARIAASMPVNIERWGYPKTMDDWHRYVENIREFTNERIEKIQEQLKAFFDLGEIFQLIVVLPENEQGLVQVNSVKLEPHTPGIDADRQNKYWKGEYFEDFPLTLTAIAKPGYQFSKWEGVGESEKHKKTLRVELTRNTTIQAYFIPIK